jgi:predicted esterase
MADPLDAHVHLFKPSLKADPRTLLLLHGTGDNEQSFSGSAH